MDLVADEKREDLQFRLRVAPAWTGVVRDEGGLALDGAKLSATNMQRRELGSSAAVSAIDGSFRLSSLAPGSHIVRASAEGYAPTTLTVAAPLANEATALDLVLRRGLLVSVLVLDEDGRELSGAVASLRSLAATDTDAGEDQFDDLLQGFFGENAGSGASGRIELGRYSPGEYVLTVRHGLNRAIEERVLLPDNQVEVELRVQFE